MNPADSSAAPLRVVLVDDTPDIRLLLRTALEAGGRFRVVAEAGDGSAGIDAVARTQPDVVLVDLAMPVLDGLEALPALRRVCPGARLVVLSGFDGARVLARASSAGADAYIQKGLDPWDLEEQLLRIARPPAPSLPAPRRRPPGDLVERAPFGVLTLGGDGVVLGANAAAHELLGAPADGGDLRPPAELAAAVRAHAPHLLAGGDAIDVDVPGAGSRLRATLAPAPQGVAAYLVPVPDGDGTPARVAVASAVHEIRNPAVVIAGVVSLLLGPGTPETGAFDDLRGDLLQALARQARLLDRATGDLLAAVQAEHAGPQVECRPVVLADVLAAAVADAPGNDRVTVDCPSGLIVNADPLRVQQMIHNLLTNAAKYGAPPVTVRAYQDVDSVDADSVRVTVEDAGPGVPDDVVPRVFEDFVRAPGVDVPGSGLGLSVVRSLARAHGGRAWYEAGASRGAVFAFTLPAATPVRSGALGRRADALGTVR